MELCMGTKSVCLITIDKGVGNWVIGLLGILVVRADDAGRDGGTVTNVPCLV